MGFMPATTTNTRDGGEADASQSSPLAFISRRSPSELATADGSHAALRVSDMERSVDFWSLLHFVPTRTFSTSGARAAWLSAPWTPLSLELIEIPSHMLSATTPPSEVALGLAHVCLDVTSLGLSCSSTLARLQEVSMERFGRTLRVLMAPYQQMMGDLVAEVTLVRAPDGTQLELVHRLGLLEQAPEPDWTLATADESESC